MTVFREQFPEAMEDMTSLRWLKLNKTKLRTIPAELSKLQQLEHLTMKKNQVESISSQIKDLPCLRTLNLRYNALTHTNIPPEVSWGGFTAAAMAWTSACASSVGHRTAATPQPSTIAASANRMMSAHTLQSTFNMHITRATHGTFQP